MISVWECAETVIMKFESVKNESHLSCTFVTIDNAADNKIATNGAKVHVFNSLWISSIINFSAVYSLRSK